MTFYASALYSFFHMITVFEYFLHFVNKVLAHIPENLNVSRSLLFQSS